MAMVFCIFIFISIVHFVSIVVLFSLSFSISFSCCICPKVKGFLSLFIRYKSKSNGLYCHQWSTWHRTDYIETFLFRNLKILKNIRRESKEDKKKTKDFLINFFGWQRCCRNQNDVLREFGCVFNSFFSVIVHPHNKCKWRYRYSIVQCLIFKKNRLWEI